MCSQTDGQPHQIEPSAHRLEAALCWQAVAGHSEAIFAISLFNECIDQSDEESDEPSGGGRWPVQQLAAGRTAFFDGCERLTAASDGSG